MSPRISYYTVQPNRWTFESAKIHDYVVRHAEGRTLNACCGPTELSYPNVHRNDINEQVTVQTATGESTIDIAPDTTYDVSTLDEHFEPEFETIVYDPPFSDNQSTASYGMETTPGYGPSMQQTLDAVLEPGGRIITLGFSTTMFAEHPDYHLTSLSLFNLLGRQDDWFAAVYEHQPGRDHTGPTVGYSSAIQNADAVHGIQPNSPGNYGEPVELTYHSLKDIASRNRKVERILEMRAEGQTLAVTTPDTPYQQPTDSQHIELSKQPAKSCGVDERTLSGRFTDGAFYTVQFAPHRDCFLQSVEAGGRKTGRDKVVKDSLTNAIQAGGRFIQVGATATAMPGRHEYKRAKIDIVDSPQADRAAIVTTDVAGNRVSPNGLSERRYSGTSVDPERHGECDHCGFGGAHADWLYVDCLKCGAAKLNYCVEDGTVRDRPHQRRVEATPDAHGVGKCVPTTGSLIREQQFENQQQKGLGEF